MRRHIRHQCEGCAMPIAVIIVVAVGLSLAVMMLAVWLIRRAVPVTRGGFHAEVSAPMLSVAAAAPLFPTPQHQAPPGRRKPATRQLPKSGNHRQPGGYGHARLRRRSATTLQLRLRPFRTKRPEPLRRRDRAGNGVAGRAGVYDVLEGMNVSRKGVPGPGTVVIHAASRQWGPARPSFPAGRGA
jgi:hypothetical protein